MDTPTLPGMPTLPPGDYAIVECFGHTTLVGRVAEVERFGTKMLQIEPLFDGELLPPVLQGGASVYRLTMCAPDVALKRGATQRWQLPPTIVAVAPTALLDRNRALNDAAQGSDDDPVMCPCGRLTERECGEAIARLPGCTVID